MGILSLMLRLTTRVLKSYEFTYIEESSVPQDVVKELTRIFESTKWISWTPKELNWYTFDGDPNFSNAGSIELSALFQREYGTGHRVYIDEKHALSITVNKSADELVLTLFGGDEGILITIRAVLEEK